MIARNIPQSVRLSVIFSVAQLAVWPVFEWFWATEDPGSVAIPQSAHFLIPAAVFVFLTLPNFMIISWELFLALKTKQHNWFMYALGAVVVVCWFVTLTLSSRSNEAVIVEVLG